MTHATEDELSRYAFDPESVPNRHVVERHLELCSECRRTLEFVRSIDDGLRDDITWELSDDLMSAPVNPASTRVVLRELAQQMAREDVDAERLVAPMLANATELAAIAHDRRFRTGGVVRLLCRATVDARESDPERALELVDIAVAIAEVLEPRGNPGAGAVWELRGTAWKERANALRLLGRLRDAVDAVDAAEDAFRHLHFSAFGLAGVEYVRATLLWERGEYTEALRLAIECAEEFDELGDDSRVVLARNLEAHVRVATGETRAAREIFEQLLIFVDDDVWIARVATSLGHCYQIEGERTRAADSFRIAKEKLATLGVVDVMLVPAL
ncbi:MAG TPA: hypothetical protein VMU84_02055 [Thermoanaerobaculia bacterium]|nr:hypothetical protein [Thermoanaerobaculia bacterium]